MIRTDNDMDAAIDWLVRLQSPSVTQDDWAEFDAWLSSSAEHAKVYDRVLAFDQEFCLLAGPDAHDRLADAPQTGAILAFKRRRRAGLWWSAGALAAAFVAGAILLPRYGPGATQETVYVTGVGERKSIALEDGTRIDLNAASRIAVRFRHGERHVSMGDAQAYFDVAKDARRPFVIDAGETQVRVVGTAFDVRHRDGAVAVAVQRGLVEVRPNQDRQAETFRLTPGQALSHVEGRTDARVVKVSSDEILGWREGRLIYRDQPLSVIAADMNRLFDRPTKLGDAQAANLRLSGVLIVDQQDAMVARLSILLPVRTTTTAKAVTIWAR
ncbi:MAG: FecR domain-containing protein [bacterium]|nr:FecR domain-containing protein [bacterium]